MLIPRSIRARGASNYSRRVHAAARIFSRIPIVFRIKCDYLSVSTDSNSKRSIEQPSPIHTERPLRLRRVRFITQVAQVLISLL